MISYRVCRNIASSRVLALGVTLSLLFPAVPTVWAQNKGSAKTRTPAAKSPVKAAEASAARQKRLNTELVKAVERMDIDRVEELLEAGADPNTTDEKKTPLLVLIVSGGLEALLKKDNGPEDDAHLMALLVKAGTKIDAQDSKGRTALLIVSSSILQFPGAEALLRLGANPNVATGDGLTPLMVACGTHNPMLAEMLIKQGAKVNARDDQGNTPLIFSFMPVRHEGSQSDLALDQMTDSSDNLPQFLLDHGADIKLVGGKKLTALHLAAMSSSPSMVRRLLAAGADINAVGEGELTPLFFAGLSGRADNGKALISRGANVNVRDKDGSTPLMAAAASGSYGLAEALMAAGADPAAKDNAGKTAFDYATAGKRTGLIGLFKNAAASAGSESKASAIK